MLAQITDKIFDWESIQPTVHRWKFKNHKIIFTNGCFDILHYGHLHYLAEAKMLGDKLIIGMNSAASVKDLKGEHRPIQDELTRQYMLASLQFVDAVIIFGENTPYKLIDLIRPDVLVKGGDWAVEQIVGADIVLADGGEVKNLPFIEGYSTTSIEEKIRSW